MLQKWIAIGMVLSATAARADLEPKHVVSRAANEAQRSAAKLASEAGEALLRGDFKGALDLTSRAQSSNPNDPWAHYVRAEALVRLGRIEDALSEFRLAEQNFPREERWSRSIAIWGRANAYYQVGRCVEAKSAFGDYIKYVGNDAPAAVQLAQKEIADCKTPWVNPLAKPAQ